MPHLCGLGTKPRLRTKIMQFYCQESRKSPRAPQMVRWDVHFLLLYWYWCASVCMFIRRNSGEGSSLSGPYLIRSSSQPNQLKIFIVLGIILTLAFIVTSQDPFMNGFKGRSRGDIHPVTKEINTSQLYCSCIVPKTKCQPNGMGE